jgi:hypothetical protein
MLENFVTYEQVLAFKELESLGFFEWLSETHNLSDTDMKPEYLDELPLNDIHRTVCNSMVFRWFREKYKLFPNFHKNELTDKYRYDEIKNTETYEVLYDSMDYYFNVEFETYEEAESACIDKLIEIVKNM